MFGCYAVHTFSSSWWEKALSAQCGKDAVYYFSYLKKSVAWRIRGQSPQSVSGGPVFKKRKKRTDWNYTRDTLLWNSNYIMANVRRNNERYECVCVWGRDIISELVVVSKWACSPACVFGFLWSGKAPQSMQRIWNWAGGNELWTFWAGSHSLLWHSASNTQTWGICTRTMVQWFYLSYPRHQKNPHFFYPFTKLN